jgi:hypothetical protein
VAILRFLAPLLSSAVTLGRARSRILGASRSCLLAVGRPLRRVMDGGRRLLSITHDSMISNLRRREVKEVIMINLKNKDPKCKDIDWG